MTCRFIVNPSVCVCMCVCVQEIGASYLARQVGSDGCCVAHLDEGRVLSRVHRVPFYPNDWVFYQCLASVDLLMLSRTLFEALPTYLSICLSLSQCDEPKCNLPSILVSLPAARPDHTVVSASSFFPLTVVIKRLCWHPQL